MLDGDENWLHMVSGGDQEDMSCIPEMSLQYCTRWIALGWYLLGLIALCGIKA